MIQTILWDVDGTLLDFLAAEEAAKVGLAGECEDSRGRRRWWGR